MWARLVALTTLLNFFASLWPMRAARASDEDALAGIPDGTAGASSLGGALPSAGSPEALGTVDLSTGSAKTAYPFKLPRARGGAQPSLSLRYDSSSGVGYAGVGWTLNLRSIVRKGHSGIPRFQDAVLGVGVPGNPSALASDLGSDDYYIDGSLLIPVDVNPQLPAALANAPLPPGGQPYVRFRTEVDNSARYFFNGVTWIEQHKNGHLVQYGVPLDGGTPAVERADAATAPTLFAPLTGLPLINSIYRWNLVRDTDESNNTVFYIWDDEHQLFGADANNASIPTAGTLFLTDIYDTANTPNPQLPFSTQPAPVKPIPTNCSPHCPDFGQCAGNPDCSSFNCVNGTCRPPSCAPNCQQNNPCGADEDCRSKVCGNMVTGGGICQPTACSPKCPQEQPCGNNSDCESFVCSAANLCAPPSCSPVCNQGAPCGSKGDCGSQVCTNGLCAAPACAPNCGTSTPCNNSGDCLSHNCVANKCAPPTCAPNCGIGTPCVENSDCKSTACTKGVCAAKTGLLDRMLGLVENEAHAQTTSSAVPFAQFAHHVHLTWELPVFPDFETISTSYGLGLNVAPYAYSPIWTAIPFAQLATVDVFSAMNSTDRQLVREYQLSYTTNKTQTRTFLRQIQLVGDCDSIGGISETGISPALLASCAQKEQVPATTYEYTGTPALPGGSPPPALLPETAAFGPMFTVPSNRTGFLSYFNGLRTRPACSQT
jgi:hypothetical protein